MINHQVIICGIVRNGAGRLQPSMQFMEQIGAMFSDHRICVYENNSTDSTRDMLQTWSRKNFRVTCRCEDTDEIYVNKDPLTSARTAPARNQVLKMIAEHPPEFSHVIWMDMDFILPPNLEEFRTIFDRTDWDAVMAYGIDPDGHYWDWLALRDLRVPFGPELIGHEAWYVPKIDLGLLPGSEWYPVFSAFGGCGVYRRDAIQGCHYSATVTSDLEALARRIIQRYPGHPVIRNYVADLNEYRKGIRPSRTVWPGNEAYVPMTEGVWLRPGSQALAWRMNSFTYQYPVTCDHVPFHASMIMKGHSRIFIDPDLTFYYGDRKCSTR